MNPLDYWVLLAYVAGIFVVGGVFAAKIKTSSDLFAAGGAAPWWVAGLSGFMTMFSAGTFVVWGSLAYRYGLVAVSINLSYGIAALLAGYFVAGKWRKMGISTPAEYIHLRFGRGAIHFYTWLGMLYRMIGMGVALYSVAVLLSALVPLTDGNVFQDPATGNIALQWSILIFGLIVVIYTVVGGLWAVLMTDVLQFIVLSIAVVFVVVLLLARETGGLGGFVEAAPDGFFLPVAGEFTWFFLAGWVAIHFFMVGADWAFVQRSLSVPRPVDARKAWYLFGGLYLVSAFVWMLPPMIYRVVDPSANPEEAYILACKAVLPAGMVGLMLAAMFSATASMLDSQINVFAGVLTKNFYQRVARPNASESHLVLAGRAITIFLGGALIALALAVPHIGGATSVILTITSLLIGPLLLPSIWGLFSRKVTQSAVWWTAGVSFLFGGVARFGFGADGFLTGVAELAVLAEWTQENRRTLEIVAGVVMPAVVLTVIELTGRRSDVSKGWERVARKADEASAGGDVPRQSNLPARVVAWSVGMCGLLIGLLAVFDAEEQMVLVFFSAILFLILAAILIGLRRCRNRDRCDQSNQLQQAR